jgi:hypothetical protein
MEKSYGLSRLIMVLLAVIGIVAMGFGLYAAIASIGRPTQFLALGIAASTVGSGLIFLAMAVLGIAILDVAENTGEVANQMKYDRAHPPIPNTAPPITGQASNAKVAQTYRGHDIEARPYGFSVAGRPFNTIEEAREQVDLLLAN